MIGFAPRSSRQAQDGQGLVEFALVLPIFLLAVVGLFDVGRLVYTNSVLSQAAREGARLAAAEAAWIGVSDAGCVGEASEITPARPGAHVCPVDVAAFDANVVDAVNRMAASVGAITAVHLSCNIGSGVDLAPSGAWTDAPGGGGNGCQDGSGNAISASGDLVSVRVEYTYQPITPIINSLMVSLPLHASATMVIN